MSVTIKYNGSNVATVEGGNTATLPVENKKMVTDIIVTVPENKGEVLPDHTESDFTLQLANTATGELGVVYSSTEKVAFDAAPNGEVIETFFDAHFVPSNIKKDVEIFGVKGEYGGGSADDRVKYVTYMDRGAELIKYPVIEGDTARDPVAKGYIEKPTKEPTASTVYTQSGWSKTDGGAPDSTALQNVTEDRTVYAAFTESARTFTVRFFDGDRLDNTEQIAYGGSSSYKAEKEGYFFDRWEPAPENITSDMDCYAQWKTDVDFATASWSEIIDVVESGNAEQFFAVGDTKEITFVPNPSASYPMSQTGTLKIVGFNHDDLADGTGKAAMSIVMVHNAPSHVFNTASKTVDGVTGYAAGGWKNSDVRSRLNSSYFYSQLPTELKNAIKKVKKKSTYYTDGSTISVQETDDKIWVLSVGEYGLDESSTFNTVKGDGTQYSGLNKNFPMSTDTSNATTVLLRSGIYKNVDNVAIKAGSYTYAKSQGGLKSGNAAVGFCI